MSIENHPNINAAGWTCDIVQSFFDRLRGKAGEQKAAAFNVLHHELVEFVTHISEKLDSEYGE